MDFVQQREMAERLLEAGGEGEQEDLGVRSLGPAQTNEEVLGRYEQAAVCVQSAFEQRKFGMPLNSKWSRRTHPAAIYCNDLNRYAALVLLGLTFFEPPIWCLRSEENQQMCENTAAYPRFGFPVVDRDTDLTIESVCLFFLILGSFLNLIAYGWKGVLGIQRYWFNMVITVLYLVDFSCAYTRPYLSFRLSPYLRAILACNNIGGARREAKLILSLIPSLAAFLVVIGLYLLVFAWVGAVLFNEVDKENFGSVGVSLWSLTVLLTTCNFPDVMVKSLNATRFSFIFFFIFTAMGCFFLLNLVLGVVYGGYQSRDEEEDREALENTQRQLRVAFELVDVDGNGTLSRSELRKLLSYLSRYKRLSPQQAAWNHEDFALAFAMLDRDGDDKISPENFMLLVAFMHLTFEKVENETFLDRRFPSLAKSPCFLRFRIFVLSDTFQYGMLGVLFLMAIFTVAESIHQLQTGAIDPHRLNDRPDSFWNIMELAFTTVFVVEVVVRILASGWRNYWRENKLAFFVTILSVVVTIFVYLPNAFNDTAWIRYTQMLRLLQTLRALRTVGAPGLLRVLRLLSTFKYFSVFYRTFISLMPAARRLLEFLFCLAFVYAAMGVQLFGGLIEKGGSSARSMRLADSTYGQSDYYNLNFNDLGSAMVTLYHLLIVNNWQVTVEAFVIVSQNLVWTWAVYLFFVSFYVLGVVTTLNCLVAFVLDAFQNEWKASKREGLEIVGETAERAKEAAAAGVYPFSHADPPRYEKEGDSLRRTQTVWTKPKTESFNEEVEREQGEGTSGEEERPFLEGQMGIVTVNEEEDDSLERAQSVGVIQRRERGSGSLGQVSQPDDLPHSQSAQLPERKSGLLHLRRSMTALLREHSFAQKMEKLQRQQQKEKDRHSRRSSRPDSGPSSGSQQGRGQLVSVLQSEERGMDRDSRGDPSAVREGVRPPNVEALVRGHEAVFDASRVTGTLTGLQGLYRVRVNGFRDSHQKAQLLVSLFERERREREVEREREERIRRDILEEERESMRASLLSKCD
uniref:EF-hand domain-containing protein n=1 Tax=Chromera velia CCMP2878 TaxID=1169474 RepID=A0A0G4H9A8_9ALVE|eukprot:Cvel_25383.t1-p1 / transcript=Cvel_25383.t1 / gene=Cvel_25383 / organism=Chromera_velia_CCMP2878 / gene_product=Two pore calcium channel protein 1, putative / transcript_product=Two pore calcium channel protein 1, putative / location=Cvel_scaffold2868:14437-21436(-) / protein_length=1026 / sequence_SO=supercontig / SO=protein_coding / is_pseudo=false